MRPAALEWINRANDDIVAAHDLLSNDILTNIVAFHGQQCIEKSLKAILEEFSQEIPRIHKLDKLLHLTAKFFDSKVDKRIISELDTLYIESRYPGDFGLLPYGKPTSEDAHRYYEAAYELFENVKLFLESRSK